MLFEDLQIPVLGMVARRAPSLRDALFNQKGIGLNLNPTLGHITTRCTPIGAKKVGRPCEGCELMSGTDHIRIGDKVLNCSGGNCLSNNVVYGVQCSICNKAYVGKTVQILRTRILQHRNYIDKVDTSIEIDDENTMAAHLGFDHGLRSKADFNRIYNVYVLRLCHNPQMLTTEEQRLVNFFNVVRPRGLNVNNPVGLGINFLA